LSGIDNQTVEKTTVLNERSFELLFKEYFSPLCLFALKYVPDMDTSKEIVHNVYLNLWEKRADIRAGTSLKTYLFTSVYNRSLNHIRDHKKFRQGVISEAELGFAGDEVTTGIEAGELERHITLALGKLPVKCREVFSLNRFEELKYKEIAAKLNISLKTVEAQMSKALKILRDELKDYLPGLIFILALIKLLFIN